LSPEPSAKAAPAQSPASEGRNSFAGILRRRAVLIAALILAGLWISGLVILAAMSANPVTLNQKQIRASDFVVTATRSPDSASSLVVSKEWIRGDDLGTITVTNLEQTRMTADKEFLVPLLREPKGRFQVTPTSLPNQAPLVYPATPEALEQLQKLLESRAK
jgi:hypothetical protein